MKKLPQSKFSLGDLIESYTENDDGNSRNMVFTIKPEQRMNLINLGFRGDETIIRITKIRNANLLEFRLWYIEGKSFSWTRGSSKTLVRDIYTEMGKKIQQFAEQTSGINFEPYARD